MKRIVRLTESDLTRIVRRVISEKFNYGNSGNSDLQMIKIIQPIYNGYATYFGHLYQNKDGVSFFIPLKDGFEYKPKSKNQEDRSWEVERLEKDFNKLVGKKLMINSDYGNSIKFEEELPQIYIDGLMNGDEGVIIKQI